MRANFNCIPVLALWPNFDHNHDRSNNSKILTGKMLLAAPTVLHLYLNICPRSSITVVFRPNVRPRSTGTSELNLFGGTVHRPLQSWYPQMGISLTENAIFFSKMTKNIPQKEVVPCPFTLPYLTSSFMNLEGGTGWIRYVEFSRH